MEKRVNLRVEHVKHSKCRQEFLDRVVSNAAKKREAKEKGGELIRDVEGGGGREVWWVIVLADPCPSFSIVEHVQLKRLPAQPREARTVSVVNNAPQTLYPLPYETTI